MVSVRSSKYRHVYGDPTRKDKCFDNIRLTKNAFDANLAKSNGKYVSLNWDASGGGSFAVLPISEQGKLPDRFPLFDGHRGPVLDTDWNPFDDSMVASASDDGTIGIWRVPEGFSVHVDYGALDDCRDIAPVKFLEGHGKKVGHIKFNPVAKDILASASLDNTIKIWNIETGEVLFTLKHPSFVTNFDWNYDGTQIASVAKDKQLRIWDVRAEKILSQGKGHAGAKGSRVVWLGDRDRVLTTGFSLVSDREMAVWDSTDISKGPVGGFRGLDPSSGIVIPHYDPMTSMVYLGGRGDGKLVYYEYADDTLYDLFAFNSTSPQRGLGWIPNLRLNPHSHEVARVYKVHETLVEPISFKVPLKNEGFLDNVYSYVEVNEPALTAEEWKSGKTSRPLVKYWKDIYDKKESKAFEAPERTESPASSVPSTPSKPAAAKATTSEPTPSTKTTAKAQNVSESVAKSDTPLKTSGSVAPAVSEKITALDKAEKQDSYDVLKSKEVQSFLARNSEEDADSKDDNEDDPAWNDEPTTSKKVESKKEAAKEEPKKVEPQKEEPKKAGPKKEEPQKEEPRKEEPKKEEPKKEEAKKVTPEKTPKKEGAKEASNEETPKKETPKNVESKKLESKTDLKAQQNIQNGSASEVDKLNLILQKLDNLSARLEKLEGQCK